MCFGNPFLPSYAREAFPEYAELASRRFFGFELPSVKVALAYLFHPARGILLFSPFFLWVGVGFARWCRDRRRRTDGFIALGGTVATFLLLAAYPNWHGGWALGSRYLLPLLPALGTLAGRLRALAPVTLLLLDLPDLREVLQFLTGAGSAEGWGGFIADVEGQGELVAEPEQRSDSAQADRP